MTPYSPNSNKENCSPVSSNCVIWQGPDLPCLNLCKGDTVSDVVYKVAVEVCNLKDSIGITDVDITSLLQICSTTPKPAQTLANILELLITKVYCLSEFVNTLPRTQNTYTEPTLALATCFQTSGGPTSLLHSQYTLKIATLLCSVYTTVQLHSGQISQLQADVIKLQNPVVTVPTYSSCLLGGTQTIPAILVNLESTVCSYIAPVGPLGSVASLNSGINSQCKNLNTTGKLLATGQYITSLGPVKWKSSPSTIGDAITNLWALVCDLRDAVKLIQDNCCNFSCSSIVVDFTYQWLDRNTLRLFFYNKTILPGTFYDCDQIHGTILNVTDGLGNTAQLINGSSPLIFRQNGATSGIMDNVTITPFQSYTWVNIGNSTSLDVTTGLTITGDVCFTDGSVSCIKCINKYIGAYVNKDCCTITAVSATTIIYKVCPVTTTTTASP